MSFFLFLFLLVSHATLLTSKHFLVETGKQGEVGQDYAEKEEEEVDSEITADSDEYNLDAGKDYGYGDIIGNDYTDDILDDSDGDIGDVEDDVDDGKGNDYDYVVNGNKVRVKPSTGEKPSSRSNQ